MREGDQRIHDTIEITFEYRSNKRKLNPYGIAHRRGHWYLLGGTGSGDRLYRVDRIAKLTVGDEPDRFSRPLDFDVRDVMNNHPWEGGADEPVTASVRFDESVAWWAGRTLGVSVEDGSDLMIDVPVSNIDAFVGWILSFGTSAEVLGPQSVRDEIRSRVDGAMERAG